MINCYKVGVWEWVLSHWGSLSLACSKVPGWIWPSYSHARIPLCLPWILLCGYFILTYTLLFWMPHTIVIPLLQHGIREYVFVLYLYSWFSRRPDKDIKSYLFLHANILLGFLGKDLKICLQGKRTCWFSF